MLGRGAQGTAVLLRGEDALGDVECAERRDAHVHTRCTRVRMHIWVLGAATTARSHDVCVGARETRARHRLPHD